MQTNSVLKIGCSRFVFGEHALEQLGQEILKYGQKALVVGGPTTLPLVMKQVGVQLHKYNIQLIQQVMDRPNSVTFAQELASLAKAQNIQVIVAIGGGKCMDLCKVCSGFAELPIITVPTSIATCAASSAVSIMYTADNGSYDCSIAKEKEVDSVIADLSVIRSSPSRLTAAGILDSLAKLPEIVNGPQTLTYPEKALQGYMAYSNACITYDFLTRFGLDAYQHPESKTMDDLVLVNLLITSMISGFSSGSDQLAVAHGLYDGVRKYFPEESRQALHGEIVAVGLLMQLRFNRVTEQGYQVVREMMEKMQMPLTLKELGVDPTEENVKLLLDYNVEKNNMIQSDDVQRLNRSFAEIV